MEGNSSNSFTGRTFFSDTGLMGMSSGDRHEIPVSGTGFTSSFTEPARSKTSTNPNDVPGKTSFWCNANGKYWNNLKVLEDGHHLVLS